MPNRIQVRRGTSTQWTTSNPTLSEGEIGFDTTTNTFKIGTGTTAWSSLTAYFPTISSTDTLTNKTINLTSNTLVATSAQLATAVTDETGSGSLVFATSPTLAGTPLSTTAAADTNTTQIATTAFVIGQASAVNPSALGTVAVGTSLRYARADHVHPTTGLGLTTSGLNQFASTTSAQLAGVISDETGSGALVFATSPTLVTPNIGVATGTSFNSITGLSSTTPSANGTAAVGTSTTVARADHVHPTTGLGLTSGTLAQFAATTSSQLAGVISDETGSGALVFGTSPTITTPVLRLRDGTPSSGAGDIVFDAADNQVKVQVALGGPVNTLVDTSTVQTLTNKTFTSPTVNTPTMTLATASSTTDARISWDTSNKKIQVGNGTAALDFASSTLVTNAQTGTTYTLVLADKDRLVELSNAAAITLTVPTDATVNYPTGSQINILQTGAGQVTVGGAGVTINGTPGLKLRAQWSSATLIKRAANTWVLVGDLAA